MRHARKRGCRASRRLTRPSTSAGRSVRKNAVRAPLLFHRPPVDPEHHRLHRSGSLSVTMPCSAMSWGSGRMGGNSAAASTPITRYPDRWRPSCAGVRSSNRRRNPGGSTASRIPPTVRSAALRDVRCRVCRYEIFEALLHGAARKPTTKLQRRALLDDDGQHAHQSFLVKRSSHGRRSDSRAHRPVGTDDGFSTSTRTTPELRQCFRNLPGSLLAICNRASRIRASINHLALRTASP